MCLALIARRCQLILGFAEWNLVLFEAPLQQVSLTPRLLSPKNYKLKRWNCACVFLGSRASLNLFTIKLYSHSYSPDTDIFLTLNFIIHKFTYHTLIWLNPLTSVSRNTEETFGRYSSEFAFGFFGAQKGKKASLPLYPESIFSFLGKALYYGPQAPSNQVKHLAGGNRLCSSLPL